MKIKDLAKLPGLSLLQGQGDLDGVVSGGYAGDLLSDVMGHAGERIVWVTCQTHENIVAVARLKNLAAIIIVNGRRPDEAVLKRARDERVPIFSTAEPAFAVCGSLFALIREPKDR